MICFIYTDPITWDLDVTKTTVTTDDGGDVSRGVVDAAAHRTPLESLAVRLAPSMEEALKKNGFDPLFPIQVWCIGR